MLFTKRSLSSVKIYHLYTIIVIINFYRCHKELRSCTAPKITEIICDECNTPQEPGNSCINCNIQFSTNYCPLCTIFTSKQIYHCNDCGLCRVGERDDMFHCHTCVACYHKSGQLSHVCAITPLTELTCPLCLDSIHSSQFSSTTLLCGHMVHFPCIKKSLEKQEYRCGLCRRSMIDMKPSWAMIRNEISMQPMPEQDRKQVNYSCFDCGHKGSTTYHYLGMECTKCNGYNTSR